MKLSPSKRYPPTYLTESVLISASQDIKLIKEKAIIKEIIYLLVNSLFDFICYASFVFPNVLQRSWL
jgi:hypothetical protein